MVADDDGLAGDLIKNQRINTRRRISGVAQGKIKHLIEITVRLKSQYIDRGHTAEQATQHGRDNVEDRQESYLCDVWLG